ncbi:MAG: hypothetical protein NWR26_02655, partial [Pseudomonadales bacterium]|nr:hypothetical protein [Pseudomonadales bacterium]
RALNNRALDSSVLKNSARDNRLRYDPFFLLYASVLSRLSVLPADRGCGEICNRQAGGSLSPLLAFSSEVPQWRWSMAQKPSGPEGVYQVYRARD